MAESDETLGTGEHGEVQREESHTDWDKISGKLLEHNYLLTALELYTESLEAGQEVSTLKSFFSNPGNFEKSQPLPSTLIRTSSFTSFDSLDLSHMSDDGRDTDERVAVLEFELRKAKETIKSLRGSLTQAAGGRNRRFSPIGEAENDPATSSQESSQLMGVARPHETRALNFLVNQFLLKADRRLTAITFSDEVSDQDLESWDSVGLNTPQPPELLQLYRNYSTHVASNFTVLEENERLATELNSLEMELIALRRENERASSHVRELEQAVREAERRPPRAPSVAIESPEDTERRLAAEAAEDQRGDQEELVGKDELIAGQMKAEHVKEQEPEPSTADRSSKVEDQPQPASEAWSSRVAPPRSDVTSRSMSAEFRQTLLASSQTSTESRLAKEVTKLMSGGQDPVLVAGRSLPHIVPNVLLNHREELIPLLLCAATQHPEERDRDQLLNILFNLIKKPNAEQRQMIITGCVAFAKHNGALRVEAELMPQCWEQITHKYTERRLLVAESCGALAPYLPSELRSSLVLSMLKQMLSDDKSAEVRAAVTKNLGLIVAFIDDGDKFPQCYELLQSTLSDGDLTVIESAQHVLLPALAAWAYELNQLESWLLPRLLGQIGTCLTKVMTSLNAQEDDEKVIRQEDNLLLCLNMYTKLLSWQLASVLQTAPFVAEADVGGITADKFHYEKAAAPLLDLVTIVGSEQRLNCLAMFFQRHTGQPSFQLWPSLQWSLEEFLPRVMDFLIQLNVCLSKSLRAFIRLLSSFCLLFGRAFVHAKVKPAFMNLLHPTADFDPRSSAQTAALTSALLPAFVCGVLACFPEDEEELRQVVHRLMCHVALNLLPMDAVEAAFIVLSENSQLHQLLLGVLWDVIQHSEMHVRCTAANLLELLVRDVDEKLVAKRVVPALVTLASDSEMNVRAATVMAFGSLLESAKNKTLLEKAHIQLTSFMDDPIYENEHTVRVEVVRTLGRVGPNADPSFRDHFVLPRLHQIMRENNESTNETKRRDIAVELLEAYRALNCCFISADLVTEHMLPALRCLLVDMEAVEKSNVDAVQALLRECEAKLSSEQTSASGAGESDRKARFMRVLRRKESSNPVVSGTAASSVASSSPRSARSFFRFNKQNQS